jgi:hypothetical protein
MVRHNCRTREEDTQVQKKRRINDIPHLQSEPDRNHRDESGTTYKENKSHSKQYQAAKNFWIEVICKQFNTCWISKSLEVEDFML